MELSNAAQLPLGFVSHTKEFWDHMESYKGDFIDVPQNANTQPDGELFYRLMTPFERKLYTLFTIKCEERDQIIQQVCGQHPRSVSSLVMRTLVVKTIQDDATPEQKAKIISLWKLADEFKNAIYEFVGREIAIKKPGQFFIIKLRPGNMIFLNKGNNQSTIREWYDVHGMGKMPKHFF